MKAKRLLAPFVVLFVGVFALNGAACQRIERANPVAAACEDLRKNLALCGYATYGTFVIFEELGVKTAADPGIPAGVREAIVRADEAAKPVADNLYDSLRLYEQIRSEIAAGTSSSDKLEIATSSLNRWITEAAPLVANLVKAVNDARGAKRA